MAPDDAFFRQLLDQSLTGVFILADQRIRWANRTLLDMLGYSAEQLAAGMAWDIVHPEDRERVRQVGLERMAGMREGEVYETRLLRRDGSSLWAEIRATPITFQGGPAVLTNAIDITDRKQAELALSDSERRFRDFFEHAPIGIYRIRPDGRLLLANPALLRMLGFNGRPGPPDGALERQAFEPTYPRSEFRLRLDRDGRVIGLESAWIRCDDSLIYVRENAQAVLDDGDKVLYFEGTVEDITRQKQSSQALALYAQRLQVKQEVDQAILAAGSAEEIVRAVVARVRRMVPCQRATVILIDLARQQARVYATAAAEEYREAFAEGTLLAIDEVAVPELLRDCGRNYYAPDIAALDQVPAALARLQQLGIRCCLTVPLVAGGELVGTLNLSSVEPGAFDPEQQSIATELGRQVSIALHQARLRTQLAEERGRLQGLIEHLPEGVLLLDAEHRVMLANPTACDYLGALAGDRPGEPGRLPSRLGCLALVERIHQRDFELVSPDEPRRVFEIACRPVPAGNGSEGWAIVLREATEEQRLQKQLRQQERQAALGALAAGVAHDFNNLLSAINGCAWILLRRLPEDDPLRKPADDIRQTCERASGLTKRLLQFSRAQAGDLKRVNLNSVVADMSVMLDRLVGSTITVETGLGLDLHPLLADPAQLEQVLVNLVINARDAMRTGGRLSIETANLTLAESDPDWPGGLGPGDFVTLAVADTGKGMDEKTLERAFEPFFSTKNHEGGTGLGLFTVQGIVSHMGGVIRIQSVPGQGTTVSIAFPCIR